MIKKNNKYKNLIIAIDGPCASGKSTLGKLVANSLELQYIDTGAMYRGVAWIAKEKHISWENETAITDLINRSEIIMGREKNQTTIKIKNYFLKDQIRSQEIGLGASIISSHPKVKLAMIAKQREIGKNGGIVMDGRDIGTYVFPNANKKIFLIADPHERAMRRYKELTEKGEKPLFDSILNEIKTRDKKDMNRQVAPLKKAPDAIEIDTTNLSIEQVRDLILNEILK